MFDPAKFTMPKTHPHKEAIMPKMRFEGGKPVLTLVPHLNGRLKVMHQGQWIGTIIPQFLDDGEEWGTGDQPYELLSNPDSDHSYRGDAGAIACTLSHLQKWNGNWDAMAEAQ